MAGSGSRVQNTTTTPQHNLQLVVAESKKSRRQPRQFNFGQSMPVLPIFRQNFGIQSSTS